MFGSDAALKLAVTKEISMANPQPKAGREKKRKQTGQPLAAPQRAMRREMSDQ